MKINIEIEIEQEDYDKMDERLVDEYIYDPLAREVGKAIKESEAWRDMKKIIYEACIERIRGEIAEEYIAKVKGES